jgi:glycosyltransferase involved in cell wall biosynthesis
MGEANPFISVVVPTCNRQETLLKCIESIRANIYPHYEIIVVDQNSDDAIQKKIADIFNNDEKIVYLHSHIRCSSDSRNRGWRMAKGDIIAFTDDDAIVDPRWLEAYAQAFCRENAKVGMVGGRIEPVFQIPRPHWLPPEKDYLLPSFNAGNGLKPFPEESLPISVNFALKRSVIEPIGGFDIRLGLKRGRRNANIGGEDSFLSMKVKEAGFLIMYQGAAIVYHPVIAQRLKRLFFLKRNFLDGITTIAIKHVKHPLTDKELFSHLKWHSKRILFYFILFSRDFILPRQGRSRKYMLRAAEMAFSLGIILQVMRTRLNTLMDRECV